MSNYIEETLAPLRKPFVIYEDGTSQTCLSNHGRVGLYVERLFGIAPNRDRRPDFGNYELKTTQPGKQISIGTMPDSEFNRIKRETTYRFNSSDPYMKIKNTVVVVYTKLSNFITPCYKMNGWGVINLESMSQHTKETLQEDYEFICKHITRKCRTRDQVTELLMDSGSVSGTYLKLSYKGGGRDGYNYPAWGFQARFMKKIIHA
jgi:hypothetical protein